MKKIALVFFLAAAAIGPAFGQAPASVGGLTLRVYYTTAAPTQYAESVDLFANGTFSATLLTVAFGVGGDSTYEAPVNGTYTYTQTSPNAATLVLNPNTFASAFLTFSTSSQGVFSGEGALNANFALTPTGGTASARALVNMSTLIPAQQGSPISFGFVVGGSTPWREVLIRAVGPSLAQFGVNNFAPNPVYKVNYIHNRLPGEAGQINQFGAITSGTGWSATSASTATITAENTRAGAFPLVQGSNDKADVFLLAPGAYTITISPTDPSQNGEELVEVYEVE